jgi:hypothetical protein
LNSASLAEKWRFRPDSLGAPSGFLLPGWLRMKGQMF